MVTNYQPNERKICCFSFCQILFSSDIEYEINNEAQRSIKDFKLLKNFSITKIHLISRGIKNAYKNTFDFNIKDSVLYVYYYSNL